MSEFNPLQLKGKAILLTGAASGIGRATAILLSKLGADLILLDLNEEGLAETHRKCKPTDLCISLDLTDGEKLANAIKEAVHEKGKLSGFAHIAGVPCIAPIKAVTNELSHKVLNINTLPSLELAKILSNKRYGAEDGGSIVLISSIYANVGSAANVVYAMSKSAIQGITKSLSIELAPKNIRVNCVAPGFIKTQMGQNINHFFDEGHDDLIEKMHPLGLGEPEDVANMIAFLLSDASKWITGSIVNVDGGFCAQ